MTMPPTDPNMPPPQGGIIDPNTPSGSLIQPQPLVAAPPAPQEYITKAQLDAALNTAREQEKAKLYGQLESAKAEVARLKAGTTPQVDPATAELQTALEQSRQALAVMQTQVAELAAASQREQWERYQAQLALWTSDRITQYETAGYQLIREMVGGENAQQIEASIQRAVAAYQQYSGQFSRLGPPQPPTAIVLQQPAVVPNGFPTAPNAAAVVNMDPGQIGFVEHVHDVTHPDAVRNGTYAQNRPQILQQLKQQSSGVAGAFSNTPRYMPSPGQLPQSTWQNVAQPQGRPTPVAVQPGQQQFAAPQAGQWPQQPQAPQQPAQWQQPAAGAPQPADLANGGSVDINAIRSQAISVAQRHLSNPAAVPSQFNPTTGGATRVPDQGRPGVAPVSFSNNNVRFDGSNPMIRNTGG